MNRTTKYFVICLGVALCLCGAQILGNPVGILACLGIFLFLAAWSCAENFTLPILLFFLPWSQLLRTSSTSFSFFTFALVLVCAMSVVKNWRKFRKYHILTGLALLFLTLLSKLLDGSGLSFAYIAFIMLLFLFPVVKEEWTEKRYSFSHVLMFFAIGVVLAALCAQVFSTAPNISRYINVDSYLTIRRMSGFYGDPNFYTAQITAVLGSCLILLLKERDWRKILLWAALSLILIYCGLLSGSKSFAVIAAILFILWIVEVFRMKGRVGFKVMLLIGSSLAVLILVASSVLNSMIDVIATRFSFSSDVSELTTGRTDIWLEYGRAMLQDWKLLFLGKGFTKAVVHEKASHNTAIQIVFQLGLVGTTLLIIWMVGFFRSGKEKKPAGEKQIINRLIFLLGLFLPWLALDILFFDEFFLLQWMAYIGLRQMNILGKEAQWDGGTNSLG